MKSNLTLFLILILSINSLNASGDSESNTVQNNEDINLAVLTRNSSGYAEITAEQLEKVLENKDFTLVNVHIPYQGEIPGTDANISYTDMEQLTKRFPDKNSTIILYCRSGSMSRAASKELVALGYTGIVDMDGGSSAWIRSGGELIQR